MGRAADFSWINVYWGLIVYIRRRPSVRRFDRPKMEVGNHLERRFDFLDDEEAWEGSGV